MLGLVFGAFGCGAPSALWHARERNIPPCGCGHREKARRSKFVYRDTARYQPCWVLCCSGVLMSLHPCCLARRNFFDLTSLFGSGTRCFAALNSLCSRCRGRWCLFGPRPLSAGAHKLLGQQQTIRLLHDIWFCNSPSTNWHKGLKCPLARIF